VLSSSLPPATPPSLLVEDSLWSSPACLLQSLDHQGLLCLAWPLSSTCLSLSLCTPTLPVED
jgi:hypothetical protein